MFEFNTGIFTNMVSDAKYKTVRYCLGMLYPMKKVRPL